MRRWWRWLWLLPLALTAWGAWALLGRDPTPAVGSAVTLRAPHFLCADLDSLNTQLQASIDNDRARTQQLAASGACWIEVAGARVQVVTRGTTRAAGREGRAVQLRVLSGSRPDATGWSYVPVDGL